MTTADVARELAVSEDTVRRWVRSGDLQPVTPKAPKLTRPRALRFTRATIDAFKQTPPPPRKPRASKPAPR